MQLKKVISISNSNRHILTIKKSLLSKTNRLVKSIIKSNKKDDGRNSIRNLNLKNSSKTKYIRSADTFGQIVQSGQNTAKIKLPSKKIKN